MQPLTPAASPWARHWDPPALPCCQALITYHPSLTISANRFIAHFVGTINLLRGSLVQAGGRLVFRSEVFGEIVVDGGTAGAAEFAIWPHALQLAAPGGPMDGGRIWADGTVTEREFLGEFVRYNAMVGTVELTVDQPHYMGEPGFAPGAAVRVGINPALVKVLSGDE